MEEKKWWEQPIHVTILQGIIELPFNVGKNLLADFLLGSYSNKSISKNRLDELPSFGTLSVSKEQIFAELERLQQNGMIESTPSSYNKFIKVLRITLKGRSELQNPSLENKKLSTKINFAESKITHEDENLFKKHELFLQQYNEPQKKAIVSLAKNILCVAGAGSGKTTVLTKRIEFLVKYKNVRPESILAITFTRKARREMQERLQKLGVEHVHIYTFNSFCETILRRHTEKIYGRTVTLVSYADKILAMNMALASIGIDMEEALRRYYTPQQKRFKTGTQLANSFMNDCFSVLDYQKLTGEEKTDLYEGLTGTEKRNAEMIHNITRYLKEHMEIQGLRDYTDQLVDATTFLKENPSYRPTYEHILVDEYQDVNTTQIELLQLLTPPNLFVVGDPRQSIFGWRGSNVNYILNFQKEHKNVEVIHLTRNYRSHEKIVSFMNEIISDMGLPELEAEITKGNCHVQLVDFESEEAERLFILDSLEQSPYDKEEIFVLARTNRQLSELSSLLNKKGIPHILRTDEVRNPQNTVTGAITLATIHAIKGLEAQQVFLLGVSEQLFPCKTTDHPAVEMIKTEEYDKLEEEKRLFYVAVSRAKEQLLLTYATKKPTHFIPKKLLPKLQEGIQQNNTETKKQVAHMLQIEHNTQTRNELVEKTTEEEY